MALSDEPHTLSWLWINRTVTFPQIYIFLHCTFQLLHLNQIWPLATPHGYLLFLSFNSLCHPFIFKLNLCRAVSLLVLFHHMVWIINGRLCSGKTQYDNNNNTMLFSLYLSFIFTWQCHLLTFNPIEELNFLVQSYTDKMYHLNELVS